MDLAAGKRHVTEDNAWMSGLGLLAVRIIQGFIYWGGGSRRFFYAPDKINPEAPHWMAYKFQTAMPGALLGLEQVISFMLQHFWLLFTGVILFSAAELIAGLFLMLGLFTRLSAFLTMGFSVLLMLMFGWQGATCIDEWTMAACNLAMGTTIFLCGSRQYALDNLILKKYPRWSESSLFRWVGGALPVPLQPSGYKKLALGLLAFVVIFNVGTYSYYRGSVVTPYHQGPVNPSIHHISLSRGEIHEDGSVSIHAYLDAGTPEAAMHIMDVWLLDAQRNKLAHWDAEQLSALPKNSFDNDYAYNKFVSGPYGIQAIVGAAATLIFPPVANTLPDSQMTLMMIDADGRKFTAPLSRTK